MLGSDTHIAELRLQNATAEPGFPNTDGHASRRCACLACRYARNSTLSIDTTAGRHNGNACVPKAPQNEQCLGDTHGGKIDAMTKEANRLLEEVLQLAPNDRAKIAAELLSSLDEQDQDVKSAWATEIARRAADADDDPEDEEDWRMALDDIRQDVLSR